MKDLNKICCQCKVLLPINKFPKKGGACYKCQYVASKKNIDKRKIEFQEKLLNNPNERIKCVKCNKIKYLSEIEINYPGLKTCKMCHSKKILDRYLKNPEATMLKSAKMRAKKHNLPFNLEITDLIIPQKCPVLGIKIEIQQGKISDNSPTLDRIIPKLGYVKGNIQIISYRANRIKSDANLEELEKIISYIKNHIKNQN